MLRLKFQYKNVNFSTRNIKRNKKDNLILSFLSLSFNVIECFLIRILFICIISNLNETKTKIVFLFRTIEVVLFLIM